MGAWVVTKDSGAKKFQGNTLNFFGSHSNMS